MIHYQVGLNFASRRRLFRTKRMIASISAETLEGGLLPPPFPFRAPNNEFDIQAKAILAKNVRQADIEK